MEEKDRLPTFDVGIKGKKEVKKLLLRSVNPADTITNFQTTRSLHAMLAKSFGTTPFSAMKDDSQSIAESLDTDSVLLFLGHLGVTRFEIHKRIADSLQKHLEEEIRKSGPGSQQPLLNLLKNCWHPATTVPEFRPILWAVLKQLGEQTPPAVLKALAEREKPDSHQLKHADIFRPLPPLLKRLVWEADWDDKVPVSKEFSINSPKEYLNLVQSTLFHATVQPIVQKYCSTDGLLDSCSKFFVSSALERRVLTNQRRALVQTSITSKLAATSSILGKSGNKVSGASSNSSISRGPLANSGKAVSQLRQLLGETASYRPKLLHAVLSMLMAHHGSQAPKILTGNHLHCTLVADILLSVGGPLPKIYSHVLTLARTLDDSVRNGNISDADMVKIQDALKRIYAQEQDDLDEEGLQSQKDAEKKQAAEAKQSAMADTQRPTTFLQRQLNRIITAGLSAMKESDQQNLFLNPVTDAIAPGYSKVIKKPMSISTMESKVDNHVYVSIEDWSSDVKLMFKNCIDYNQGSAGQWFRGEAARQSKVFKDEIVPQAHKLYQVEVKKRTLDVDDLKRKRDEDIKPTMFEPLTAATKKRKLIESQDFTLSMAALASMLLADPFVVRLLLDRVLRSLRVDVLPGLSIPASHTVIPSLLQLLHIANFSTQICAVRGRRYLIPDSGVTVPEEISALEEMVPYESLRRYLPLLMRLSLEAELDKRVCSGGDLNSVVDTVPRISLPRVRLEKESPPNQVIVALLEGLFVYFCTPGNSLDSSLATTFEKFASALQQMAVNLWDERAFFVSLVPSILRYKGRLNRRVRDTIIDTWISWLSFPSQHDDDSKKKKRKGSMTSAGHEYLIQILNEWASFGNLLMPRDLLVKVSLRIVKTVEMTEISPDRKFLSLWTHIDRPSLFEPIKKQYEKMLGILPESRASEWRESVGIDKKISDEGAKEAETTTLADETDSVPLQTEQEGTMSEDEMQS